MTGAGLAGNPPQSAFGASQEGGDATAKGRVLSPHIFSICRLVALHENLGMDGSKCPPTIGQVSPRGGSSGILRPQWKALGEAGESEG